MDTKSRENKLPIDVDMKTCSYSAIFSVQGLIVQYPVSFSKVLCKRVKFTIQFAIYIDILYIAILFVKGNHIILQGTQQISDPSKTSTQSWTI